MARGCCERALPALLAHVNLLLAASTLSYAACTAARRWRRARGSSGTRARTSWPARRCRPSTVRLPCCCRPPPLHCCCWRTPRSPLSSHRQARAGGCYCCTRRAWRCCWRARWRARCGCARGWRAGWRPPRPQTWPTRPAPCARTSCPCSRRSPACTRWSPGSRSSWRRWSRTRRATCTWRRARAPRFCCCRRPRCCWRCCRPPPTRAALTPPLAGPAWTRRRRAALYLTRVQTGHQLYTSVRCSAPCTGDTRGRRAPALRCTGAGKHLVAQHPAAPVGTSPQDDTPHEAGGLLYLPI